MGPHADIARQRYGQAALDVTVGVVGEGTGDIGHESRIIEFHQKGIARGGPQDGDAAGVRQSRV